MNHVILILGMHRSGTSALTRVISLLGAALPKSILGKNESNLRGHWESEPMIAAHDALLAECDSSWMDWRRLSLDKKGIKKQIALSEIFTEALMSEYNRKDKFWVVKEPRICRFADIYIDKLEENNCETHSIIMVRNPLEVAASLKTRDNVEKLDALNLWLTHMLDAELATRGRSRSFVSYDGFLNSAVSTTERLTKDLPFKLPYTVSDVQNQIESYVSPGLKRQKLAMEDVLLDPLGRGWVSDAYEAFHVLCENPTSKAALKKLDDVRGSYFPVLEPLHDLLSHERGRLKAFYDDKIAEYNALQGSALADLKQKQERDWAQRDEENAKAWADREHEYQQAWAVRDAETAERWSALEQEHKHVLHSHDEEHQKAWIARDSAQAELIEKIQGDYDKERQAWQTRVKNLEEEHEEALEAMERQISFMRDEFGTILTATESRADRSAAEAAAMTHHLSELLNSTSWKMTGGLRKLLNLIKGRKTQEPFSHLIKMDAPPRLEDHTDGS